jgi:UDPglucose 6-dehydrogenase
MGFDDRIGPHFLNAGLGYGGSCFPKDVLALAYMAEEMNVEPHILHSVMETNANRRTLAVKRIIEMTGGVAGKTIGFFGLSFKPNTDDMRDAPSIDLANALMKAGAKIRAYDPVAMEVAKADLPDVEMVNSPYEVAEGADAVMVNTEWNEFKNVDLVKIKSSMKSPVLFDGRNIYEPAKMQELGFTYRSMGRGFNGNGE